MFFRYKNILIKTYKYIKTFKTHIKSFIRQAVYANIHALAVLWVGLTGKLGCLQVC